MSLEAWLEKNLGFEVPNPGLSRIKKAIGLLGLGQDRKKIITIGGTNGKGQTSRELYHHAHKRLKAALWTSPHLASVTERFVIEGKMVEEQKLLHTFKKQHKLFSDNGLTLSYYEFLFACFLELSKDCELLVLEVGLGGRFDAVNALDADMVLLTSIGRDHQDYLGPRLDGILEEKFQLARPGRKLISAFELAYLREGVKRLSKDLDCDWEDLFLEQKLNKESDFSERNMALAHRALEVLFGNKSFKKASGPFTQFFFEDTECHAVSAHNPDGIRKCVQFLRHDKYTNFYKLILMSLSKREKSDGLAMLKSVLSWATEENAFLAVVGFDHPKAMEREKLGQLVKMLGPEKRPNIKFFNDAKEALQFSPQTAQNKPVLVLGSNYFIGSLAKNGPFTRR